MNNRDITNPQSLFHPPEHSMFSQRLRIMTDYLTMYYPAVSYPPLKQSRRIDTCPVSITGSSGANTEFEP